MGFIEVILLHGWKTLMEDLADHFGKRTQNQHAEKEHVLTQQGFTCINKLILCFIIYHQFRINTSVPM